MKYEKNIGPINSLARLAVGFLLLLGAFSCSNLVISIILAIVGFIMIIEAFLGHCFLHNIRKTKNIR